MSLFSGIFCTVTLPFSLCMESTSYAFPFRMVFFYLVTTGWIFGINQLMRELNQNSFSSINQPAGSQQLRVQDPVLVRRCGTVGRTAHHGQERGIGNGNRDRGGDEREDVDRNENKGRGGARTEERTETRIEIRVKGRENLGT